MIWNFIRSRINKAMILISETTLETTLALYLDFRVLESSFWCSGGETTKLTLMQVCLFACLFAALLVRQSV